MGQGGPNQARQPIKFQKSTPVIKNLILKFK